MNQERGTISINIANMFPIIKKWLYSDKDIFLRELVSNASDAVNKLKMASSIGEANISGDQDFKIIVELDKKKKTIKVIDNGIGMTADEVKKYINQVAFSGAEEFLKKYQDKVDEENQIIGHFGLGFYSAFMVSEKVQIDTLSHIEGAQGVCWISKGDTEYEMKASNRSERGTTITLYIAEDSQEFLDRFKLQEILDKYCAFLPVPIYLIDVDEKDSKKEDAAKEDEDDLAPINDTNPLWLKNPSQCTDEEYKDFYKKVFNDYRDPLFWIHLNVDYPFNLKGILYFPKLSNEFEVMEGQVKLYNNQVFVADNIKEVIPEFLLLLKGAIDCPDLPLNVSRSFLQNDGFVKKISAHITKKVADKLVGLFKTERDNYDKYWDDINPFIKYGCMRDDKFYDRVKDIIIYKNTDDEYLLLKEYLERNKDKHKNEVFYITDEKQQAQYIKMFKENDLEAVYLTTLIDRQFIQYLEFKESDIKFKRIDADLSDAIKDKDKESDGDNKEKQEALEAIFKEALENDKLTLKVEALKTTDVPALVLLSEQSRRMQEFSQLYGMPGMSMPQEHTLVLNSKNNLVDIVAGLKDRADKKEDIKLICRHIYDLAMMSHKQLEPDEMAEFIKRSTTLLTKLAQLEYEG